MCERYSRRRLSSDTRPNHSFNDTGGTPLVIEVVFGIVLAWIDAFVVRKSAKTHGLQRLIEGSEVSGRRVLVVEDTSTTGNSALTAVHAVEDAGGEVVGVATVVDRATGAAEAIEAEGLPYRSVLGLTDLGLG